MSIPPLTKEQSEEVERTIQAFEQGKLTYDQARKELSDLLQDHPALYFAEIELFFAWELKVPPTTGFKI